MDPLPCDACAMALIIERRTSDVNGVWSCGIPPLFASSVIKRTLVELPVRDDELNPFDTQDISHLLIDPCHRDHVLSLQYRNIAVGDRRCGGTVDSLS